MRLTENVLVVVRKGSEQVNGSELYNEKGQFSIMGTECALLTLYVTAKRLTLDECQPSFKLVGKV